MMKHRVPALAVILVCLGGLFLQQCAVPLREEPPLYTDVAIRDIPGEIKRLERLLGSLKDQAELAGTHLRLSLLYASYRNPAPDYRKALKHMESHLTLTKGHTPPEEIRYLHGLLKALRQLADESRTLQQKASQLERENSEMKEVVEKLKHLDIRMEERRRQIK